MASRFLAEHLGPAVLAAQDRAYGQHFAVDKPTSPDALGEDERAFIAARDSFYLATVGERGWPHLQHRGGPKGFLRVLSPTRLAFADVRGNRQLISTGNATANPKVALLLMDYPNRTRLKIIGEARIVDAADDKDLVKSVAPRDLRGKVERVFVIDVAGFDWNCPAFITPRFDEQEVAEHVAPLHRRIAELEARLAAAKR